MASGQQKATENLSSFIIWQATMTDDGFRQIVFRGGLNRGEIAKACGFGKSALNQNPQIKSALKKLEDDLRTRNVLPQLTEKAKSEKIEPKKYDKTASQRMRDAKRVAELEQKVLELETRLKRFGELSEVLMEMGIDV
ncbi:VPA1267 family protein [uncultured Psychromonas sp.]|uniref:VPA1267 family protein n=1 Tax=uncultured Psychromonas sp. TaxID=173974 RepID=UPI0026327DFB|nr:VPA1267 family protein [uncultured Psychromonas sp.]